MLKGDFAKLARLQAQIKTIASTDFTSRMANVVGAAGLTELQLGFRQSRDPYGRAWDELKLREGGKPLLDTGRLRSSFSYQPSSSGFTIGSNFIGTAVHQYGALIRPKKGKFLRFPGRSRFQRGGAGGGSRRVTSWIFAREVVIPRRQMVPEGTLGERWDSAFKGAATRFVSRIMKG